MPILKCWKPRPGSDWHPYTIMREKPQGRCCWKFLMAVGLFMPLVFFILAVSPIMLKDKGIQNYISQNSNINMDSWR